VPVSFLAKSPGDVNLIVFVHRQYDRVGTYTIGQGGFSPKVTIIVINRDTKTVVAQTIISGGMPAKTIREGSTWGTIGSEPNSVEMGHLLVQTLGN